MHCIGRRATSIAGRKGVVNVMDAGSRQRQYSSVITAASVEARRLAHFAWLASALAWMIFQGAVVDLFGNQYLSDDMNDPIAGAYIRRQDAGRNGRGVGDRQIAVDRNGLGRDR